MYISKKWKFRPEVKKYTGKKRKTQRSLGTATHTVNIEVKGIEEVKQLVELLREANELAASLENYLEQQKKSTPNHRWK